MEIITNNQPRRLLSGYELTPAERAEFDWMDESDVDECEEFVRYKGRVYSMDEFMLAPAVLREKGWDGYAEDSFFSGVALKEGPDTDSVVLATVLT